ncbi:unnamed protein product [Calypogeia fissa]
MECRKEEQEGVLPVPTLRASLLEGVFSFTCEVESSRQNREGHGKEDEAGPECQRREGLFALGSSPGWQARSRKDPDGEIWFAERKERLSDSEACVLHTFHMFERKSAFEETP